MKKIVIFLCAVLILCSSCDKNSKFLSVTGTGSVTFVPNLVKFSLTVRQTDPVLANSVSKTKNEVVKILDLCTKYGVKDEDIKSSWISTNQEYHWQTDKKVFDGYASNQTTDIIFRDLDKLEEFTAQLMRLDIANMN
ncbi:MAG: SIMPL domain-containing protein, partial [Spirochaetia bacterium]|nr:SIMPL domain-containing protein [Spirochaetia bacterium]